MEGDVLPVQIVVTSRLAKEESLWLRNLTNKLKSRKDAEELVGNMGNIIKSTYKSFTWVCIVRHIKGSTKK